MTTDSFTQMYPSAVHLLYPLRKSELKLLFAMVKRMRLGFNNYNVVTMNLATKIEISKEIEVGIKHINNTLPSLVEQDLLRNIDRGEYRINPMLFFRGAMSARKKMVEEWYQLNTVSSQPTPQGE